MMPAPPADIPRRASGATRPDRGSGGAGIGGAGSGELRGNPATEVPRSCQGLTAEWLSGALSDVPGLEGVRWRAAHADPDAEARGFAGQIARIVGERVEPGGSRSVALVAKLGASDPELRAWQAEFGSLTREVRFYQEIAGGTGLPVPDCPYAAADAEEHGVLLLEDLGAARMGDQVEGASLEQHRAGLRALARLHARFWNAPELMERAWLRKPPSAGHVRREYRAQLPSFCEGIEATHPRLVRAARFLGEALDVLELAPRVQPPFTLVHGDLRLDNVVFDAGRGREVVLLDWQNVGLGSPALDVATWLVLNLTSEQRREHGSELLELYYAELRSGGGAGYPLIRLRFEIVFCLFVQLGSLVITHARMTGAHPRGRLLRRVLQDRLESALADYRAERSLRWMVRVTLLARWIAALSRRWIRTRPQRPLLERLRPEPVRREPTTRKPPTGEPPA